MFFCQLETNFEKRGKDGLNYSILGASSIVWINLNITKLDTVNFGKLANSWRNLAIKVGKGFGDNKTLLKTS